VKLFRSANDKINGFIQANAPLVRIGASEPALFPCLGNRKSIIHFYRGATTGGRANQPLSLASLAVIQAALRLRRLMSGGA